MSTFSYNIAKALLTEAEKERIICTYLNTTDPNANVDWDKAAAEYGSKSVQSYRKMMQNTAKKLKEAEANGVSATSASASASPAKEAAPVKGKGGRKRKGKGKQAGEGGEEVEETPKKKGRKGKGKKAADVEEGDVEEGVGEDEENIKAEMASEEDMF
ncbi:hypothetical protein WHR41_06371 [Cladosporium halotolerans]|uniref:Uncharacterized protein n=1 Tax=Cladosporium halotolerans TaxID=1052096 RepID=A0AB34KGV1_9PEZI